MKVKELLEAINKRKKKYKDFLEWEVAVEIITAADKKEKKKSGWKIVKDEDKWEYIEAGGFHTTFADEKIFTINVNY